MTDQITPYPHGPAVAAILAAIEERLGWRADAEDERAITVAALRPLLDRGIGHLGMQAPDRVWARPFQEKGGIPCVAVTVFWGQETVHITAQGPK